MIRAFDKKPYRWAIDAVILAVMFPLAWQVSDRQPPWVRLSGMIEDTRAGEPFVVKWLNTPNLRYCPGVVQVEIISGPLIWPVMRRAVGTADLPAGETEYNTPPWPLPSEVPPGNAIYRVTTFWYCNWVQKHLDWPVKQVGPDIQFKVLPARSRQGERGERGEQGIQGEPGK